MNYKQTYIPEKSVPRAIVPLFQHIVDTYASETNKTASLWRTFIEEDLAWRPHPRSFSVEETMRHQLLSERRFFSEFLGSPEPPANETLPAGRAISDYIGRLVELAVARLGWLSQLTEKDWLEETTFFDVKRERIWVFWRRVLHTAHHRTQLSVCLRLLDRPVPPTYGPTADVTWKGADPTLSA